LLSRLCVGLAAAGLCLIAGTQPAALAYPPPAPGMEKPVLPPLKPHHPHRRDEHHRPPPKPPKPPKPPVPTPPVPTPPVPTPPVPTPPVPTPPVPTPPVPPVPLEPHLEVRKSVEPAVTVPGGSVTYTIRVSNTGNGDARDLHLTDDLSRVLTYSKLAPSVTSDTGQASIAGQTVTWTGDLPAGQTATISYSVRVKLSLSGQPQDKVLDNLVSLPGSNCAPGSADPACTTHVQIASLRISVTEPPVVIVQQLGMTGTVLAVFQNSGSYPFTDDNKAKVAIDLSQVLKYALYNDDATIVSGPGSLDYQSPQLAWSGPLAPGQSARIQFTYTTNNPATDGSTATVLAINQSRLPQS
jgi:uncharacterized repeat protein (TIGR01451 family)